jgi:hypothetical protein
MINRFQEVKVRHDIEATEDNFDFLKDCYAFLILIKVFLKEAELAIFRDCKDCIVFKDHFTGFRIVFIIVEEVWELGVGGLQINNIAELRDKLTDFRLFRGDCSTS